MFAAILLLAAALSAGHELEALQSDDECSDGVCALSALQLRGASQSSTSSTSALDASCHDAVPGEACYDEIMWALTQGIFQHPDWYPGLSSDSSHVQFQMVVHKNAPGKCPSPCVAGQDVTPSHWCDAAALPRLWAPAGPLPPVRVLSYNLFWWSLFKARKGNGNSAGLIIKTAADDVPIDFMGFQECEDPNLVLQPVGLLSDYEAFLGPHAVCMAYRKATWELLEHGAQEVAEDMPTRWYGKRGSMWMRLKHRDTGATVLFLNHHGPLSVNSGGICGGTATATNLMQLMSQKGQVGDLIILVGDFNANAASLTIQGLWPFLTHAFAGDSFGGVDNIFTNAPATSVLKADILGSGGSDHTAVAAVIAAPRGPEPLGAKDTVQLRIDAVNRLWKPAGDGAILPNSGDDWQTFWCGRLESGVEYVLSPGDWSEDNKEADPDRCCRACQREARCKAWIWSPGPTCKLRSGVVQGSTPEDGSVSGMPALDAGLAASSAAKALPPN